MKDPDRLSPDCRVHDTASSVAPAPNLHAEFVAWIAAVPEQIDHDPGSLPGPEMIGSADHLLYLQLPRLVGIAPRWVKRRAVSLPPAALQG
jgi:hypothetical protein